MDKNNLRYSRNRFERACTGSRRTCAMVPSGVSRYDKEKNARLNRNKTADAVRSRVNDKKWE